MKQADTGSARGMRRRPKPGALPGTLVVDPSGGPAAVHILAYRPDECLERGVEQLDTIRQLTKEWPVLWVNVNGLGDEQTILALGEIFDLHGLALADVTNVPQRPKAEQYGQTVFLVMHMLMYGRSLSSEQLSLFLTDRAVITFQQRPGDCLDTVRQRIRQGAGRIRSAGADYLAYALLDTVIDHYFPVLETYGERLGMLEDGITEQEEAEPVSAIRRAKRDLMVYRRMAWPLRDAVNWLLREDAPLIQPETRPYLRDCYDHVTRVIDMLETHRELASDLMAVHLSVLSNQMNAVMKTLTVMAAIFIPLTFIAGVYGMNFEKMPELKWQWGYAGVWAIMVVVAAGMVAYFRRKKWL